MGKAELNRVTFLVILMTLRNLSADSGRWVAPLCHPAPLLTVSCQPPCQGTWTGRLHCKAEWRGRTRTIQAAAHTAVAGPVCLMQGILSRQHKEWWSKLHLNQEGVIKEVITGLIQSNPARNNKPVAEIISGFGLTYLGNHKVDHN